MKRILKIGLWFLGVPVLVVVAALVATIVFLDSGVKAAVEKGGSYAFKVPVTLDKASVSILGGRASLQGLTVGNPAGYKTPRAIYLGETAMELKIGSVTSEVIEIPEMKVLGPQLSVEGDLKGSNISQLLKNLDATIAKLPSGGEQPSQPAPAPEPAGPEQKYRIGKILVTDAQVGLSATFMGGQEATARIPRIEIVPGDEPMTMAQLLKKIIGDVLREAAKDPDQAGKMLGGLVSNTSLGEAGKAGDLIKKGTETIDKVKDLFRKKSE